MYEDWTAFGALVPDAPARAAVLSAGSTLADELTRTHGGIVVFMVREVGPLIACAGLPEYVDAFAEMLADVGAEDDEPPSGPVWAPSRDVD